MNERTTHIPPRDPDLRQPFQHRPLNRTARRYAIWSLQIADGHEPCFGTPKRLICEQQDCPYRPDCLSLRANWLR